VELTDLPERIRNRVTVDPDSGCWVAGGAVTSDGYALVHWEGQCRLLHRVVWELANGQKIPKMHVLDHLREDRPVCPGPCRYRNCIHPDHLEPVTVSVNSQRVVPWNRKKTHCPQGHAYAEHGLSYTCKDGRTRRFCSACDKARKGRQPGQQEMAL